MSRELRPNVHCPTCCAEMYSVVDSGASWYECEDGHQFMRRSAEDNRHLLDELHTHLDFKRRLRTGDWNQT